MHEVFAQIVLIKQMDLTLLVEQVLMVCPDISRVDVEKDLAVTRDVQETVNRIFEGNVSALITGSGFDGFA